MQSWEGALRQKFPALRLWTYLNAASAGPLALEVARAGFEVYESLLQNGDADWEDHLARMNEARQLTARLAGCASDELAFTRNTSHGASLVAQMLWDEGKRTAVALRDEFPSSTLPFLQRGFDVRFVDSVDGRYPDEAIAQALEGRDLLIASQVIYQTGFRLDPMRLGAIARASDARFMVCVTQSMGALPVDFAAWDADYVIGTSHKWMCAGYGAGLLAVARRHHDPKRWPQVGWLSQRDIGQFLVNDRLDVVASPRAMEAGCAPSAALLTLGAASRLWLEAGPERVEARILSLTERLRTQLSEAGATLLSLAPHERSGITIVAVDPASAAPQVVEALKERRVQTSARGAGVRFAIHAYNDESDIDRAVEALVSLGA